VSYYDQIVLAGGKPVIIGATLENDFKIRPDQLDAAITGKTRLVIFNSPSNPTGMVYSGKEMEAVARMVQKHEGVFIMSDEVYEHILFEGEHVSMASFDFIYDRVITVNAVSKAYAMTGWRVGYLGAPVWIVKACDKLQGQFTSGVCAVAQRAALAALTGKDNSRQIMRDAFLRRRDLICKLLKEIEGIKVRVPQGAFMFCLISATTLEDQMARQRSAPPTNWLCGCSKRHRLPQWEGMLLAHLIASGFPMPSPMTCLLKR